MMAVVKIFIDIPADVRRELSLEGRSLEKIIESSGGQVGREELAIEGEYRTRGIFTTILISIGTWILMETGKKVYNKLMDPLLERLLEPVIKKIKKKKGKLKIEFFRIEEGEDKSTKKLTPLELPKDGDNRFKLTEDIYLKITDE